MKHLAIKELNSYERYALQILPYLKNFKVFESFELEQFLTNKVTNIPLSTMSYILRTLEKQNYIKQIGRRGNTMVWEVVI
jgi:predicted transcriptional regulator